MPDLLPKTATDELPPPEETRKYINHLGID